MPNHYARFTASPARPLARLLLCAGLCAGAACQSDSGTRQVASAAPSAPPADSVAPATDRVDTPPQPAAPPPASRGASQPRRRGSALNAPRRGPTTLSAASAADTLVAAEKLLATDAAAVAARRTALREFLLAALPPEQTFTVRSGRDTLLCGAQGACLLVPAYAWSVPAGTLVQVQLREFHSLPAMLMAGLNTTSNDALLETGGMLHLSASAAGRPLDLRPGAALRLYFPTRQRKPGMQTFRGEVTGTRMNWQPDAAADTIVSQFSFDPFLFRPYDDIPGGYYPRYQPGARELVADLRRIVVAPEVVNRLLHTNPSAREQATCRAYNQLVRPGEKVQRLTEVEFTVDSTGRLTDVRLRPGFDAELAAPVLPVVRGWQRWQPARRQLTTAADTQPEPVAAVGVVRVTVTATHRATVQLPAWDPDATQQLLQRRADAAQRQLAVRRREAYRQRVAEAARRASATGPNAAPTAQSLYYELESFGTGWINCDRFMNSPQPLVRFAVPSPGADTKVMLVFQDARTLLAGTHAGQQVTFGRVPGGTRATLVVMRWVAGQAQLALQPLTVAAAMRPEPLQFRSVSTLQLQQALARLE